MMWGCMSFVNLGGVFSYSLKSKGGRTLDYSMGKERVFLYILKFITAVSTTSVESRFISLA